MDRPATRIWRHDERAGLSMAVMFIDLDGSKTLTTSMGHEAVTCSASRGAGASGLPCVKSHSRSEWAANEFTVALTKSARDQILL